MLCLHCLLGVLCLLILKSLSHFEVIFIYGMRECSNFIDLHSAVQLSQHPLAKETFFHSCPLCQKIDCKSEGLFLDSPFCSNDFCVCFCASIIIFFYWCSFVVFSDVWMGYTRNQDCFGNFEFFNDYE